MVLSFKKIALCIVSGAETQFNTKKNRFFTVRDNEKAIADLC
jgi:hypothetical protein